MRGLKPLVIMAMQSIQLMGLLNKISPKMARKIAEKGAKKAGVSGAQAATVGKTVEKVVEKQHAASGTAPAH